MGWKTNILPDHVLRRLPPAERKPLGKAGLTTAEAGAIADRRAERVLQNEMEGILRQRNLFFVRSRMDKRTSTRRGLPDFIIILHGERALLVEAKVHRGQVSADQAKVFADYRLQTGGVVHLILNLPAFIDLLNSKTT
jgi:hypothetical protein